MEENDERWYSCITFAQDRCPNLELIERVRLFQEKRVGADDDTVTESPSAKEEARACCRECADYRERYGTH